MLFNFPMYLSTEFWLRRGEFKILFYGPAGRFFAQSEKKKKLKSSSTHYFFSMNSLGWERYV
jgi:hypothetical protein